MGIGLLADMAVLAGLVMSFLLVRYERKAWFVVAFWGLELVYRLFSMDRFGGYASWGATAALCLITFAADWHRGKVIRK